MFNNGFSYSSPYMSANSRNTIQWVNGIEGAKAYSVFPNSNVMLMDSNRSRFYIKTADANGMCAIKIYDFQEVTDTPTSTATPAPDLSNYVTREELNKILDNLTGGNTNEH